MVAIPIRLRDVRNDGAVHRLQRSEQYFAFPVIELAEDSARPSPRTNEFSNQGNSESIFSKSISDVALP
jgi:hypothetical protein